MKKRVVFTVSAIWDDEAGVWTGSCDEIPAAAAAPTLDELMAKISRMALDFRRTMIRMFRPILFLSR